VLRAGIRPIDRRYSKQISPSTLYPPDAIADNTVALTCHGFQPMRVDYRDLATARLDQAGTLK
jgi:hypothetical protein